MSFLSRLVRDFRGAFRDVAVRRAEKRIVNRIQKAVGAKPKVVYDAAPKDKNGVPLDNLDEVPVQGLLRIEDDVWDTPAKDAESPTWLELAVICDEMIRASGDFHHVYLEGIEKLGESPDGRIRICFDLGS